MNLNKLTYFRRVDKKLNKNKIEISSKEKAKKIIHCLHSLKNTEKWKNKKKIIIITIWRLQYRKLFLKSYLVDKF